MINGLSLKEVKERLSAPFPASAFGTLEIGKRSVEYLDIDVIEERLNDVVGVFNWSFNVEPAQVIEISSRKAICLVGRLSIYDDDGRLVCEKSSCGGAKVIISSATGEAEDIPNDCLIASRSVFKQCCKSLFGVFKKDTAQGQSQSTSQPAAPNQGVYTVTFKSPLTHFPKGYKAQVVVDGEYHQRELIIWESIVNKLTAEWGERYSFEQFMDFVANNPQLKVVGETRCYDGKEQLIFSSYQNV